MRARWGWFVCFCLFISLWNSSPLLYA